MESTGFCYSNSRVSPFGGKCLFGKWEVGVTEELRLLRKYGYSSVPVIAARPGRSPLKTGDAAVNLQAELV